MTSSRVRDLAPNRAPAPPTHPLMDPDSQQATTTAPLTVVASPTRWRTAKRRLAAITAMIMTIAVSLGLAIAPVTAAIVAIWETGTAIATLERIVTLARAGQALSSPETPGLLRTLDAAVRAGFLATGYLALIFALITLMAGLFGRGWGRLFILPGAAFTATALALIGIGALLAAPLANTLPMPAAWLIPLGMYALVDAVLVSGVMVDAQATRSPRTTRRRQATSRPPRSARPVSV